MSTTAPAGAATYSTPTDTTFVCVRVFDAPRALVFDAWTSPKLVPRWLLGPDGWTMPVCEIDLRPGGPWRYVWRNEADGREMAMSGKYLEVVPPERVVCTERYEPYPHETTNRLEFTEAGGKTTVTLTVTYPSKEVRDMAVGSGMARGMDRSFERLDELVREPKPKA
jgi:uncharacterized protein YndB with AHSA1/START domain